MSVNQYTKVESTINKAIIKYGRLINLHQKIDPTVDPLTRITTYNNVITPIKGIVKDFSVVFNTVGNVELGDKNVRVTGSTGKPNVNDELDFDGYLYKVIDVKEMSPGGTPLFYDIHVRKYSIVEDPSAYALTLGDLRVGSVVYDPSPTPFSPEWIVIANDHHGTGISTLMVRGVTGFISFDGTSQGASYYPSTPWSSTYMRYYLHNGFKTTYLSDELQSIMQTVTIETQTKITQDSVSLLSKEELFNSVQGSSSGTYIAFFDSDTKRIAYSDVPEAVTYWTRDMYSGTAPDWRIVCVSETGKVTTNWDYTVRYNRPMIFINKSQRVVINSKGLYEFKY